MTVNEAMKYFDSVKTEPSDAAEAGKVLADKIRELTGGKRKFLVEAWEHRQVSYIVEANNEEEAKKVAEDVYMNDESLQERMVKDDESVACEEFKVLQDIGKADGIVDERTGEYREDPRRMSRASIMYCLDHIMHALNDEDAIVPWLEEGIPDGLYQNSRSLTRAQLEKYLDIDCGQDSMDELVARFARILFGEVYPRYYKDLKARRPIFLYSYKRKVLT